MADELRAQPDALSHVGTQLANHGETLLAVQQACRGAAEDAQSGWVGSSAGALSGLLDRWETASTTHIGRFGGGTAEIQEPHGVGQRRRRGAGAV